MAPQIPDLALRAARRDDYDYAERLYLETIRPLLERLDAYSETEVVSKFKGLYEQRDVRTIHLKGKKIGWIQVKDGDQEIVLVQIHIEAPYRSRGIGSHLIEEVLDRARTSDKPVSLYVVHNNPAISLYRRLGFTIVGQDSTKLHMRWQDHPISADPG